MPASPTKRLRVTHGSLALLGLAGAAVLGACSAGGADPSFWDPGAGEPLAGGGGGTTSGASSGGTTSGGNTSTSSGSTSGNTSTSSSSSTSSTGKTSTSSTSSSSTSSTSSTSGGAVTWTQIYNGVFGPSGTSTCTGSSCHTGSRSGFACGSSASSCYKGFVNAGYITPGSGASSSALVDPSQTCLCGSGLTGNMPKGHSCLTSAQVSEIKTWLAAGAPNN